MKSLKPDVAKGFVQLTKLKIDKSDFKNKTFLQMKICKFEASSYGKNGASQIVRFNFLTETICSRILGYLAS